MPRDVDEIVRAARDRNVAILVHDAGITKCVVASKLAAVGGEEAVVVAEERLYTAWRHRQLGCERAKHATRQLLAC